MLEKLHLSLKYYLQIGYQRLKKFLKKKLFQHVWLKNAQDSFCSEEDIFFNIVKAGRIDLLNTLIAQKKIYPSLAFEKFPLHKAVKRNHYAVVKALLAQGFNVNQKNKFGYLPIDLAYRLGRNEIMNLLLRYRSLGPIIRDPYILRIKKSVKPLPKWKKLWEEQPDRAILRRIIIELKENGLLLPKMQIDEIKASIYNNNGIKIKRRYQTSNGDQTEFSVIKIPNKKLFALYRTKDAEMTGILAESKQTRLKFAQDLSTSEICLVKIIRSDQACNSETQYQNEWIALNQKKRLLGKVELAKKRYLFIRFQPGITIDKLDKQILNEEEQITLLLSGLIKIRNFFNFNYGSSISHNDLHEGNILVDLSTFKVKFIDFGSSTVISALEVDDPVLSMNVNQFLDTINKFELIKANRLKEQISNLQEDFNWNKVNGIINALQNEKNIWKLKGIRPQINILGPSPIGRRRQFV